MTVILNLLFATKKTEVATGSVLQSFDIIVHDDVQYT